MTENKKCIYIVTNPSIPAYVKIGYADDLDKRLNQMNSKTEVPLAFRKYAYYEVNDERLKDTYFHEIIEMLNPSLRSKETVKGKTRTREFFAISKETAYKILKNIAEISDTQDRLHLCEDEASDEVTNDEDAAETDEIIDKTKYDKETFLSDKNPAVIERYEEIVKLAKEKLPGAYDEATQNYIALRNERGHNICEFIFQKARLLIHTRKPVEDELQIGRELPSTYLWSLNYQIIVSANEDLNKDADKANKIVRILSSAYEMIK